MYIVDWVVKNMYIKIERFDFVTNKEYSELTKKTSPGSKVMLDCINAFWVGGTICLIGQIFMELYGRAGLEKTEASMAVSITLIGISIILTGLTWYQKIAKFAGAGTLVPITGFANAMSSPAIEFKAEGHILGIGTKLFSIAGPVIAYGVVAAFVYGLVLVLIGLF